MEGVDSRCFDVAIIGAGPAGCHCARLLAKSGYRVLLVEQHDNVYQNDFSSAGTPIETLAKFDLPQEVVGSFWRKIVIVTTNASHNWEAAQTLGVVLNFAKLREFLAQEVKANGGEVWFGCRYVKYSQENENIQIFLKPRRGHMIAVGSRVLVDATGFSRAVMYDHKRAKPAFLSGTGIEYLIEVEDEVYEKYVNSLIFLMGHKWMPRGYSWIFPMENNRLKVGAGCLSEKHKIVDQPKSLKNYIKLIIEDYIQTQSYKILDIHGSTLQYSSGLQDKYYRDRNIIAIGDAVSTVNFLGGEGIRHAMDCAEIACRHIQSYLSDRLDQSDHYTFHAYQQEMHQQFAKRWNLSEKIGRKRYLEYSDRKIDRGVAYLSNLTTEDIMDILFYYKFEKLSKGLWGYFLSKIRSWI
jgi:digeranylgeranylglycerophospholipid reductase